jgi:CubicO group peptidase (beta-lactamase class C family)
LYFGGKKSGWTKEARILSPLTIKMMTTIPEENDPKVGRALGWDKKSDYNSNLGDIFDKDTTIGHTGYTGTSVVIDMKTRTAVILLAHRVHPKDEGSVSQLRSKVANIVAASILYPVM